MRKQILLLVSGLVIILGSAYVHAVLTNRWGSPADLSAAAEKLDRIPHIVGDWHSEPVEIPENQLRGAEAVGHFARVYRNDKTQKEVQVLILCGPHGPIAVHPPTICFTSAGLQQTHSEKKQPVAAGDLNGEFWNTLFSKRSPDGVPMELETYWAWSQAGETVASDNPRLEFASSPHLYKIYVTHLRPPIHTDSQKKAANPPCEEFLKVFLPEFHAALSEP